MSKDFAADHLDIGAFAHGGALSGQDVLRDHARLMAEAQEAGGDQAVTWSARGELREVAGGPDQVWLHLLADAVLPMTCQRCLHPVDVPVHVDRAFRFVADEATAAAQDDESEEDLLVHSSSFNLLELVEDELIMELPVVPKHETCPVKLKLAVADEDFEAAAQEKTNPFAVLQKLQTGNGK